MINVLGAIFLANLKGKKCQEREQFLKRVVDVVCQTVDDNGSNGCIVLQDKSYVVKDSQQYQEKLLSVVA